MPDDAAAFIADLHRTVEEAKALLGRAEDHNALQDSRLDAIEAGEAPPPIPPDPDPPPPLDEDEPPIVEEPEPPPLPEDPPPPPVGPVVVSRQTHIPFETSGRPTRVLMVSTDQTHADPDELNVGVLDEDGVYYVWLEDPDTAVVDQVAFQLDGVPVNTEAAPNTAGEWWYAGAGGTGAIDFDQASSLNKRSAATAVSWAHTCSGTDRALMVFLRYNQGTAPATSVKYGGVDLTNQVSYQHPTSNLIIEIWTLLNPAAGTATIAVSYDVGLATPERHLHSALSFVGVGLIGVTATKTDTTTTPDVDLTTTVANAWLVGAVIQANAVNFTSYTPDAGTVERDDLTNGTTIGDRTGATGDKLVAAAGAANVGFTRVAADARTWAAAAVELKPKAGGGGGHLSSVFAAGDRQIDANVAFIPSGSEVVSALFDVRTTETPPPPPPPPPPPTGVDVTFDSANPYTAAKVSAEAAGSSFYFTLTGGSAGGPIYEDAVIPTKTGNQYVAEPGVILDGNDTKLIAFIDSGATNIRLDDFEIRGYLGQDANGLPNREQSSAVILRDGWRAYNLHVHDILHTGVRFAGNNILMDGGRIHHCEVHGFGGSATNSEIRNVEIDHTGTAGRGTSAYLGDWGASKMVHTVNMRHINLWVHDNPRNGLWTDINNSEILYDGCLIEDNKWKGIFHEISFSCEIRNCVLRRNGINANSDNWPEKSNINISTSPDVWIHDNLIEVDATEGHYGISAWNASQHPGWTKADRNYSDCLGVRNLLVERNTIIMSGPSWIAAQVITGNLPPDSFRIPSQRCGQFAITDSRSNNRIRNNTRTLSGGKYPSTPYIIAGKFVSPAAWAAAGYN